MKRMPLLFSLLLGSLLAHGTMIADSGPIHVSEPSIPVSTPAVRDMPQHTPDTEEFITEAARRDEHGFVAPYIQSDTWLNKINPLVLLQQEASPPSFTELKVFGTPIINVAGYTSSSSPPDDTGDVGKDYYVQGINSSGPSVFAVYRKSDGYHEGTWAIEDFGTGSCVNGYCDPIILYDQLAERWVITEFDSSIRHLCVLVSHTSDPLGSFDAYDFDIGTTQDYPKYGVWSDGYYVAANNGGTIHVLEREQMLLGDPATFQSFSIGTLSGFGFQLTMPASYEGKNPPPANEPAIYMRPRDTEINGGTCDGCDLMEMWQLSVDWDTPANSSLTQIADVEMSDWDQSLCGNSGNWDCMPQQGTTQKIDPIREPIHFPLQYRNFGSHETLVGCFAEDVDSLDHAAVHWFEIRREAGGWYLNQDGVVGGDSLHRSVCGAAMDGSGNIAVAYTRTGTTAYPSIYYSGRLASDTPSTMPYYDQRIIDATNSKTNNERWGDYAGIGVDPVDDCTFWFTTEYGGLGQTRVASFKFDACGCLQYPPKPNASTNDYQPDRIDISWDDSSLDTVIEYNIYRSTTSGGPYTLIHTESDSSPGTGNGSGYTYSDTPLAAGETYYYVVEATDGAACISEYSDEVSETLYGVNIVFQADGNYIEITGNGDPYLNSGEKWSVDVTLRNDGNLDATNVTATLSADGITLCNSPGAFGSINQGGSHYQTFTFQFVIDTNFSSANGCPADILFDVTTKTSSEMTPSGLNELDIYSRSVASGGFISGDEAGVGGTIAKKTSNTFLTANYPVSSVPGILSQCTVDISLTPPMGGLGTLIVTVEHDPGEDGTFEYSHEVYNGAGTSWSNVTDFLLPNLVDGAAIGNGYWRLIVYHPSFSGGNNQPDGTLSSWTLHLTSGSWDCTYVGAGTCGAAPVPEVSANSPLHLTSLKNGGTVDLTFEDVGAGSYNLYASNLPDTHDFSVLSSTDGNITCGLTVDNDLGTMLEVLGFTLESGISGDTSVIYYIVTADSGSGTEGTLGEDSSAVSRTADERCNP